MSFTILTKMLLSTVCGIALVLAEVPPPENVRITSLNMGLLLEWDAPSNASGDLTYTAEYKSWNGYAPYEVCQKATSLSCDFTSLITAFGVYMLRVRAELHGEASDWLETKEFTMDAMTELGAPGVALSTKDGDVNVHVTEPVLKVNDFRKVYGSVTYTIHYWTEGEEDQAKEVKVEDQNRVPLRGLTPLVRYCVQVQLFIPVFNKTSESSDVTCVANSEDGKVQPWVVVVALLVSFVVVAVTVPMLFLAVWYIYRGVRFLHPKATLPEHFKEWMEPTRCPLILVSSAQPEELYHQISIILPEESQSSPQAGGPHCTQRPPQAGGPHCTQASGAGGHRVEREKKRQVGEKTDEERDMMSSLAYGEEDFLL